MTRSINIGDTIRDTEGVFWLGEAVKVEAITLRDGVLFYYGRRSPNAKRSLLPQHRVQLVRYAIENIPPEVDLAAVNDLFDREQPAEPPVVEDRVFSSDGGASDYYSLPAHATELRHLISEKGMSKARGDIFKACFRLGAKAGVNVAYDLNKMKFFIQDLIEMHERGEHL